MSCKTAKIELVCELPALAQPMPPLLCSRLWTHSAFIWWRKGILHHLLGHWDTIYTALPDSSGTAHHCVCHQAARTVFPHSLGLLQADCCNHPCCSPWVHHCLMLFLNPGSNILCSRRWLEFFGIFLLLFHFPEHHWPWRLCARRGLQSKIPRAV